MHDEGLTMQQPSSGAAVSPVRDAARPRSCSVFAGHR
jgi:hypothetical protein